MKNIYNGIYEYIYNIYNDGLRLYHFSFIYNYLFIQFILGNRKLEQNSYNREISRVIVYT